MPCCQGYNIALSLNLFGTKSLFVIGDEIASSSFWGRSHFVDSVSCHKLEFELKFHIYHNISYLPQYFIFTTIFYNTKYT